MVKKTMAGMGAFALIVTTTFANGVENKIESVTATPMPISADAGLSKIAYYGNSNVEYVFDKNELTNVFDKGTKFLYEVKCDRTKFLNSIGMSQMPKQVKSFSFENDGLNVYADLETCAMNGSSISGYVPNNETITESEALKAVEQFESSVLKKLRLPLGEKFVSNKYDNMIMYAKDAVSAGMERGDEFEVVDDNDSGTEIGKEYQSIEITYPILISGKSVTDQYGNVQGVTVTVNGTGKISYFNVPFSNVKLTKRTSKTLSTEKILENASNGGNSPYYSPTGTGETVKFEKMERTPIFFSVYSNGKSKLYVGSGTKLVSDKKKPYANGKYETTVSDYEIGNVNVRY